MTQQSRLFSFAFSPPLFFHFSILLLVLAGFILVGKDSGNGFRILQGLVENKVMWVVERDFHGNFRANLPYFFITFLFGLLDWIVLILVWFETHLHPAQVCGQSCPWLSKLMTSQMIEGTWILQAVPGFCERLRVVRLWMD